ncbi:MAG: chaperone modulator CbpM [Desulfovibrio sp.]|jgi:chaperone modulatory protein CbpM|nr:chaperone modulator CbpM [Desulfovibrio sp.]
MELLAYEEFVEVTGIAPDRLQELLALGWIETEQGQSPRFFDGDVYKVRKLERLCCDLEVSVVGGTIIVDLLERIDMLERTIRTLQGLEDGENR